MKALITHSMVSHASGIAMITFVVAVAVSLGYYQFFYIPQVNAKPFIPKNVLNPVKKLSVSIVKGAQFSSNPQHYFPDFIQAGIGYNNEVVWTNNDSVPHTVTSNDKYVDQSSGPFNTIEQLGKVPSGYIMPGKTFDFVFTKLGEYHYHCLPHPFMQGTVSITQNFS
jgi:plastocyanin